MKIPAEFHIASGRNAMIGKFSTGTALATCLVGLQLAIAPASAKDFGAALKPADKDGKGKITKVSLDGKILDDGFLPAKGQVLNKPKGIWIVGDHLWVTDIDSVWEFDLKTK
jgi:hypothetical protein